MRYFISILMILDIDDTMMMPISLCYQNRLQIFYRAIHGFFGPRTGNVPVKCKATGIAPHRHQPFLRYHFKALIRPFTILRYWLVDII
jgi:hypothetical protein